MKDTFALGHAAESEPPVREMWEFIRRYMDEGPEALVDSPFAKYVALSVAPTLRNCMLFAVSFTNATTPLKRVLLSPFIALFTVTRWVVFAPASSQCLPRTSRRPVRWRQTIRTSGRCRLPRDSSLPTSQACWNTRKQGRSVAGKWSGHANGRCRQERDIDEEQGFGSRPQQKTSKETSLWQPCKAC